MTDDLFDVESGDSQDEAPTIVLRLHVQPAAGRTAVSGRHGDALRVRVAAPPVGGRANEACARLVADTLGVRADQVELVSGASSRSKRFRVRRIDLAEARRLLEDAIAEAGKGPGGRPGR